MPLDAITLDDKYVLDRGRVLLTGIQALVRLPMMQRDADLARGLNTAGCISGYRGSPLGALDLQLWKAKKHLDGRHISFKPGLNEDLGATVVWGSQQVNLYPDAKYDGVFGMWYGKGPGVDRSGDVFKHANHAGTSKHGGVLVLVGDDHSCKSSTLPHQTEHNFTAAQIPVLNPAGVQDIIDYGLHGWAMSRFSGCWVAMKTIAETVETTAAIDVAPDRIEPIYPEFDFPEDGVHIRWPDDPKAQELRLMKYKIYAALAYARANKLNKVVLGKQGAKLGILTTGKAYLDVMQAIEDLGLTKEDAEALGIRVMKVGMTWPLNRDDMRDFAEGLDEIIVVEEKRALIENQLKEQLYNWRPDVRPMVIGKFDEDGEWILPSIDELTPARIARVIAKRLKRYHALTKTMVERLDWLDQKEQEVAQPRPDVKRLPWYCPGCPHNTSTKVPEGSRALAGIGCHYMTLWMDRSTETVTQMGGEGANWIGQADFTNEKHVFQNLGDGTYYHSGSLAVRAAVAAGVNITYKLLYNDAVAMTGGQPVEGQPSVAQITQQMYWEGVRKIVVVSDEPDKYPSNAGFAPGVSVEHRDEMDRIQKDLSQHEGVTMIVYDQTCAAEKRRRRKRKLMVDPPRRIVINEAVCEGCGDCGEASNCLAVAPLETEFGRKRTIDQSACNKDFSCVNGFCPSFVSVIGGQLKKRKGTSVDETTLATLPTPTLPSLDQPYSLLVTGIGGTGVVTIGAILSMAAHMEGKGVVGLDMAGLAQKGGAVVSHVRLAKSQAELHAARIPAGEADLVLGCDLLVAASFEGLAKMRRNHTFAVINSHKSPTGAFVKDPDFRLKTPEHLRLIEDACGKDAVNFVGATPIATRLLGDSIATNLFMLGYAWQLGRVPVTAEAIMAAIELNGAAVTMNQQAFLWGRLAAHDLKRVEDAAGPDPITAQAPTLDLAEKIDIRTKFLTDYQDAAYAERYTKQIERVKRRVDAVVPGADNRLVDALSRSYFKLLAIKDEYEVARLYTDGGFEAKVSEMFEGDYKLNFHLAPPLLADKDLETGRLKKKMYGPWMMKAFKLMAGWKTHRGTWLDPFGHTEERRMERRLITEFETVIDTVMDKLSPETYRTAVALFELPMSMRGFGHVKHGNVEKAKVREAELLEMLDEPERMAVAAE